MPAVMLRPRQAATPTKPQVAYYKSRAVAQLKVTSYSRSGCAFGAQLGIQWIQFAGLPRPTMDAKPGLTRSLHRTLS